MKIGTDICHCHQNTYQKKGIFIKKKGGSIEKGSIEVPIDEAGQFGPKDTKEININYDISGCFKEVMKHEYYETNIDHPTNNLRIVVCPPEKYRIKLKTNNSYPHGKEIFDNVFEMINHRQMELSKNPIIKDNKIIWTIEKPKLNHRYVIHFKICLIE